MGDANCPLNWKQVKFTMKSLLAATLILAMFGFSQVTEACVIAAENVGQRNFTWRIEYFGNEEKNVEMQPGDHTNHECLCVPMDMYVDYEDLFCHHTFNCIYEETYSIEITDYQVRKWLYKEAGGPCT